MWRWLGIIAIIVFILSGVAMILHNQKGLYMGLILAWAGPFVLLLWYVQSPSMRYTKTDES